MSANEFNNMSIEPNECTSRGLCSISPGIASLQELARYFIMQSAYYIQKLEDLSLYNPNIKFEIINIIASLVYINEYSEKQMFSIVFKAYYIYKSSKNRYIKACEESKTPADLLESVINFTDDTTISQAIALGAVVSKVKTNIFAGELKNYVELLLLVFKSVSLNISTLADFNIYSQKQVSDVIKSINSLNNINKENLLVILKDVTGLDYELQLKIADEMFLNFGNISEVNVSHSSRKGKCILVSGSNFFDLLKVLELTNDKNIDVYTYSNLLIAHAFEKFRKYENFKGHFGKSSENCIVDYGTFPGAILLTKNSKNNTEYLYRGKIFSNDYVTPQGVIKLENNYDSLIKTAQNSKGFSKGKMYPASVLGFDYNTVKDKLVEISDKLKSNLLKRLYIIFPNYYSELQKEYLNDFYASLRTDEFLIDFCDISVQNNVLSLNVGNYFPLVLFLIEILMTEGIPKDKVTLVFTSCDVTTISSVIKFGLFGFKNKYMFKCSARAINPTVFDNFIKNYNISLTSNPYDDLKEIRKKYLS